MYPLIAEIPFITSPPQEKRETKRERNLLPAGYVIGVFVLMYFSKHLLLFLLFLTFVIFLITHNSFEFQAATYKELKVFGSHSFPSSHFSFS